MSAKPKHRYTLNEYFELERTSEIRYEYWNGEVFAMSGAQPNHNRISVNLIGELHTQLKTRTCQVFGSDQRVKVEIGSPYLYPDVSVACPKPEFEPISGLLALINPNMIVEILSPTTAEDDKKAKFLQYQTIPTFQEYLLIEPDEVNITHYIKQADGTWLPTEITDVSATLHLDSIGCTLALQEIYRQVELAQASS